jgi:hypothetical protein
MRGEWICRQCICKLTRQCFSEIGSYEHERQPPLERVNRWYLMQGTSVFKITSHPAFWQFRVFGPSEADHRSMCIGVPIRLTWSFSILEFMQAGLRVRGRGTDSTEERPMGVEGATYSDREVVATMSFPSTRGIMGIGCDRQI